MAGGIMRACCGRGDIMFGFFKKKREQDRQFAIDMMRAAAEGAERSRVTRAIATVGLKVDRSFEDEKFRARSVVALVRDVAKEAGQSPIWIDDEKRFTAGIFAFTLANALSYRLGVSFEKTAHTAAYILTAVDEDNDEGETDGQFVDQVGDIYNHLTLKGHIVKAIGEAFIEWLVEPTAKNYAVLAGVYGLLGKTISKPN
jgi:hypothetical protein